MQFYSKAAEDKRLSYGLGPLEFERNKSLISQHLKLPKTNILDVGGGPGVYASWLADLGHQVQLIDPVQKHIQQATARSKKSHNPFKVTLAEAQKLPVDNASIDLLILHGPLYHLPQRENRIQALRETLRVLKPGGIVLGFAISATASTLPALLNGFIHDEAIFDMCLNELQSGFHDAPKTFPGILPHAFYHRPDQLKEEFLESGLCKPELYAVEGMVWLEKAFFETWTNPLKKQRLMELLRVTEKQEHLLAFSPHIMISAEAG